jgi:hypothetical protein
MTPLQKLKMLRLLIRLEKILMQYVRNQNLIDGMKPK